MAALAALMVLAAGCRRGPDPQALAGEIRSLVDATPSSDLSELYAKRNFAPLWVVSDDLLSAAIAGLAVAEEHGLPLQPYGGNELAARATALRDAVERDDSLRELATLDVQVSAALLTLGRDVARGIDDRKRLAAARVTAKPVSTAAAATLSAAADRAKTSGHLDIRVWLDEIGPPHPEYVSLTRAMAKLLEQQAQGGWPAVHAQALSPGSTGPSVAQLRTRLAADGALRGNQDGRDAYDDQVETAVGVFQEHHALKVTGVADPRTIAAMNVPIDVRIQQVAQNLARWRSMPDDFGSRHFLVNIPQFHVFARENGQTVLDIRVVVGKPDHRTPIFSDEMETVVFSPYWNVPDSIVENETAPAVIRDPQYLTRNAIDILRRSKSGATMVDAEDVNWDDPAELRQLAFRQRPGARNALGHVKFLFPNSFDVYLHDTPADTLFARPVRAFSHGCVRVEDPLKLAMYVLRDDPKWDETRILAAMHSGVESGVKLAKPIPVHIVYLTAWADDSGGLFFFPDIYGYDARPPARSARDEERRAS